MDHESISNEAESAEDPFATSGGRAEPVESTADAALNEVERSISNDEHLRPETNDVAGGAVAPRGTPEEPSSEVADPTDPAMSTPASDAKNDGVPVDDRPDVARPSILQILGRAAPASMLWCVAGAFPILGIVSDGPEFLSAHRMDGFDGFVYAAVICLAVPALAMALALLSALPKVGIVARALLVAMTAAIGFAAGMALHRFPGSMWWLQLVAAGFGAVFAIWWASRSHTKPAARWLGFFPVAILAWFVFGTPSGSFIRTGPGDFSVASSITQNPPPVVMLVFDEFPVDVLLDSSLNINKERFPNFARLASMSHWYPLASSVSGDTYSSVPALLSGQRATTGKLPVAEAYATNLLKILSPTYDIASREAFTRMCNASFCTIDGKAPADPLGSTDLLIEDTAIVWQHGIYPERWQKRLPSIDGRFVNFAAENPAFRPTEWAAPAEHLAVKELVETTNSGERPMMWFGHFILPHFPYKLSPSGDTYTVWRFGKHDSDSKAGEIGRVSERQRLTYQVMAVDKVLGEALDTLEERGELDDAAIVLTADHGRNFWKGLNRYPPQDERIDQITAVPLFIKAPGQTTGEISWDSASTMDIAPTLLGALDVKVDAEFAGVDLFNDKVPSERTGSFLETVLNGNVKTFPGYLTPRQSKETLRNLVDRMSTLLTPDGGVRDIVSIGTSGKWVGSPIAGVPKSTTEAPTFKDMASIDDPVIQVRIEGSNLPDELIATRGDTVVGVGLTGAERKGKTDVAVIVTDESIEPGETVRIWAVYPDGVAEMEQIK